MPPFPMGESSPSPRRRTSGDRMECFPNSSFTTTLDSPPFRFSTISPVSSCPYSPTISHISSRTHSPTSHAPVYSSHFLHQLPTSLPATTTANSVTTTTSTSSTPRSPPPTPPSSPLPPLPPPPSPARCLSDHTLSRKTSPISCHEVPPSFTSGETTTGMTSLPTGSSEDGEDEKGEGRGREDEEPPCAPARSFSRSCHRAPSPSHSPPPSPPLLHHSLPSRAHHLTAELRLPLSSSQEEEDKAEEEEKGEKVELEDEGEGEEEEERKEGELDEEEPGASDFFDDNSELRLQYVETAKENQQQESGRASSGGAPQRRRFRPNARHPLHLSCALLLLLAPSLLEPRKLVTATDLPSTSEVNILQDNKGGETAATHRSDDALRTTQLRHHRELLESVPPQSPFMLQSSNLVTPSSFPPGATSGVIAPEGTPIAATVIAQHGSNAFLPCTVRSLGNKSVSWVRVRDAHILTIDRYTFIADERFRARYEAGTGTWTLQVKYVQPRDQGLYECQVSTEPKISHILNLTVITPHVMIDGGSELHVRSGSIVTIKCVIYNSIHDPEYIFWYRDDERIAPANTDEGRRRFVTTSNRRQNHITMARFTLLSAALSDAGNYSCLPAGLKSASVSLHVLEDERPAAMQHEQGTTTSTTSASRPTSSSPRVLQPMNGWLVHLMASVGPLWCTVANAVDLRFRPRTTSKS